MGTTTESVLVRGRDPQLLAKAVRQAVGSDYEELPAGAKADRTIVVWATEGSAWTAVLDTYSGEARKLAKALSGQTAAVAVNVFDSDEAWLRLYQGGKLADTLSLRGKIPKLRAERWAEALEPPAGPQDFAAALTGETVFVEDRVSRAAKLLGADPQQCLMRANELDDSYGPLLRIGFRSKLLPEKREAEGPPRFEVHDRFGAIEAGAGDALQQLALSVRNTGGESRGVEVRLEGEAVDNGVLAFDAATLVRFLDQQQTERTEMPFVDGAARDEAAVVPAAAAPADPETLGRMLMADPSLLTKGKLWVNFAARAAKPGAGTLRVRVRPLANPSGETVWEAPVRVSEAIRKPRRSTEAGSLYARKLSTPNTLVGLAVFDADKAAARATAADAIRSWVDAVGPVEGRWRLHWNMLQFDAPRNTLIAADKSAGDKAWGRALGKLEGHESVWAPLYADKEETAQAAGFLFDAAAAPHLGFWVDLRGADSERRRLLHDRLTQILDAAAAATPLLQGFLAAWDAEDGLTADHTLYEMSCGIVGQGVRGAAWCERWLRAVAETMWLGPALGERAGNLESVAELEPAGSTQKVTLREEASLDALEAELAPILPSVEDWQAALRGFYARG